MVFFLTEGVPQKPTPSTLRAKNSEYPHYHYDILHTAYSVCTWLFHISFSVIGYEKVMLKDINLKKRLPYEWEVSWGQNGLKRDLAVECFLVKFWVEPLSAAHCRGVGVWPRISQDEKVLRKMNRSNSKYGHIIYEWFLSNHDIVPVWMDNYGIWGVYDKVLGRWTGAIGKVIGAKCHNLFNLAKIFLGRKWRGRHCFTLFWLHLQYQ